MLLWHYWGCCDNGLCWIFGNDTDDMEKELHFLYKELEETVKYDFKKTILNKMCIFCNIDE